MHDNLGTIVGAGVDTFTVQQLPAPVQLVLAVRLLALAEELDGEPHVTISRVRDPSGDLMSEVPGEIGFAAPEAQQEWLNGIMLPSVVQFEAPVEGTYMIEHSVDGSSNELPIHIVLGEPPGVEQAPDE